MGDAIDHFAEVVANLTQRLGTHGHNCAHCGRTGNRGSLDLSGGDWAQAAPLRRRTIRSPHDTPLALSGGCFDRTNGSTSPLPRRRATADHIRPFVGTNRCLSRMWIMKEHLRVRRWPDAALGAAPFYPARGVGRPREWCSQRCRRAAYEERRAAANGAIAIEQVEPPNRGRAVLPPR